MTQYERIAHLEAALKLRDVRSRRRRLVSLAGLVVVSVCGLVGWLVSQSG
ncbi:MAG: hypothetical protein NXI04_23750 [Planctomycetaceae bacterium]|nr:hypothetical protein [Planctomycetaceae bacterium]